MHGPGFWSGTAARTARRTPAAAAATSRPARTRRPRLRRQGTRRGRRTLREALAAKERLDNRRRAAQAKPMTLPPFHLAFPVDDLAAARHFYGELLGCPEGRSAEHWIDFNLYGH